MTYVEQNKDGMCSIKTDAGMVTMTAEEWATIRIQVDSIMGGRKPMKNGTLASNLEKVAAKTPTEAPLPAAVKLFTETADKPLAPSSYRIHIGMENQQIRTLDVTEIEAAVRSGTLSPDTALKGISELAQAEGLGTTQDLALRQKLSQLQKDIPKWGYEGATSTMRSTVSAIDRLQGNVARLEAQIRSNKFWTGNRDFNGALADAADLVPRTAETRMYVEQLRTLQAQRKELTNMRSKLLHDLPNGANEALSVKGVTWVFIRETPDGMCLVKRVAAPGVAPEVMKSNELPKKISIEEWGRMALQEVEESSARRKAA